MIKQINNEQLANISGGGKAQVCTCWHLVRQISTAFSVASHETCHLLCCYNRRNFDLYIHNDIRYEC